MSCSRLMLSRLVLLTALVALLAGPLAACGRKNPPRRPVAADQTPAQAPAQTPDQTPDQTPTPKPAS